MIGEGSVVEVSLKNKEKLKGRMGPVAGEGFEVQVLEKDQTQVRALRFEEVKNVRLERRGMSTAGKIVIGVLVGFGVLMVIGVVAAAATGGFDS